MKLRLNGTRARVVLLQRDYHATDGDWLEVVILSTLNLRPRSAEALTLRIQRHCVVNRLTVSEDFMQAVTQKLIGRGFIQSSGVPQQTSLSLTLAGWIRLRVIETNLGKRNEKN
ncbi:MAG: hypothetical protein ACRCYY_20335 [Trueperaceae bacterium]